MQTNYHHKRHESSLEFIEDIAYAFKKSRVLLTASDLNIFEAIGYRSLTARQISESLLLEVNSTERLLNVWTCLKKKNNLIIILKNR